MIEYFLIAGFSMAFAFLAMCMPDRKFFVSFAFCSMLCITLPAVVRYGIGTDYVGTYSSSIEAIAAGKDIAQEFSYKLVVEFVLNYFREPHWVFVFYSLVTYIVAFWAMPRKGFGYAMSSYFLMYYAFTLSGIRQGLAASFTILALLFYFRQQYVGAVIVYATSIFWHTSAVILLPLVVVAEFAARVKMKYLPHFFALVGIFLWSVPMNDLFLRIIAFTPYARYLDEGEYIDAVQVTTGLGYIIPAVMFLALCYVLYTHQSARRQTRTMAVLCGFAFLFYMGTKHVEVFNRLSIIANSVLLFAVVKLARLKRNSKDKLCLLFVFLCMIVMFCKEIITDAAYGITPYRTIFDAGIQLW